MTQELNLPISRINNFQELQNYLLGNINHNHQGHEISDITALRKAISKFELKYGSKESSIFYDSTLPGIIKTAAMLKTDLRIDSESIKLSRAAIASILAHLFLCNGQILVDSSQDFVRTVYSNIFKPHLQFSRWYKDDCEEVVQMIFCFINYFHEIINSPLEVQKEEVTFKRCCTKPMGNPVENPHKSVSLLVVDPDRKEYLELDAKVAKVVFIENDFIGARLFTNNCFQEEIMLATHPEMMIAGLFENLDCTDAVVVTGAKKYSLHQGFGVTFRFTGTPSNNQSKNKVVFVQTTTVNQYDEISIKNDLQSAYAGFYDLKYVEWVNLEFWAWSDRKVPLGYPCRYAVIANPAVKILTIWLAASMTFKNVIFRQYINYQLGYMVDKLSECFKEKGGIRTNIGEVYNKLIQYCILMSNNPAPNSKQKDKIFNIFTLKPGYHKVLLSQEDTTWSWLISKMQKSIQPHARLQDIKNYNIVKIYQFFNYRLWERFLERKWEMEKVLPVITKKDYRYFFHGSKSAEIISRTGFDISKGSLDGMLGQGAYFTDLSSKGNQYTLGGFRAACADHNQIECTHCTRTMLVCKVMMGTVYYTKGPLNGKTSAPDDCHSVEANPKDYVSPPKYPQLAYPEFAVYNNFQAYPSFLLEYKIVT